MITRFSPRFGLGFTSLFLTLPITLTLAVAAAPTIAAAAQPAAASTAGPPPASAPATAGTIRGRVTHHDTHEPVPGARVVVEELNQEATTGSDGAFAIGPVAAGTYHLRITAKGLGPSAIETTVPAQAAAQPVVADVELEPELHYSEVLSVSPNARDPFESYQPTTVLSGQDLSIQMAG